MFDYRRELDRIAVALEELVKLSKRERVSPLVKRFPGGLPDAPQTLPYYHVTNGVNDHRNTTVQSVSTGVDSQSAAV